MPTDRPTRDLTTGEWQVAIRDNRRQRSARVVASRLDWRQAHDLAGELVHPLTDVQAWYVHETSTEVLDERRPRSQPIPITRAAEHVTEETSRNVEAAAFGFARR